MYLQSSLQLGQLALTVDTWVLLNPHLSAWKAKKWTNPNGVSLLEDSLIHQIHIDFEQKVDIYMSFF